MEYKIAECSDIEAILRLHAKYQVDTIAKEVLEKIFNFALEKMAERYPIMITFVNQLILHPINEVDSSSIA